MACCHARRLKHGDRVRTLERNSSTSPFGDDDGATDERKATRSKGRIDGRPFISIFMGDDVEARRFREL